MAEYTSYFVGIPLAKKYQSDFEKLLKDLSKIDPSLETAYPLTPHLTVFYLNKHSQPDLLSIAEAIKDNRNLLKDLVINVGGFGYFREDNPKVLFLGVSPAEQLEKFNRALSQPLANYSATDNDLPFRLHMTVGKFKTQESQDLFKQTQQDFKYRLNQISWAYPVTELYIYGVDSTKSPQFQEKLVKIPVNTSLC